MEDIQPQYKMVYTANVPAEGQLHQIKLEAFRIVADQRKNYYIGVREAWRFGSSG